jgi:Ca2+-binding EF-hand superfamily protein
MFDQDKSGTIDFEEFLEMLKYLNLPIERNTAQRIFAEAQKGDGTIGQDE